jgi:hypothetical protein
LPAAGKGKEPEFMAAEQHPIVVFIRLAKLCESGRMKNSIS